MSDLIKAAYDNQELPLPEHGSMCYMMSKQQYFGDKVGNAGDSHLMFWFPQGEHMGWGAEASDSPVTVHQYSPNLSLSSRFRYQDGPTEPGCRTTNENVMLRAGFAAGAF
jgi:hypothetical protein